MPRKRIYDEDLRLNVIINGKGLEKGNKKLIAELGNQERKMRELEMAAHNLEQEYKKVVKAEGAKSASAKRLKTQLNDANAAIRNQQIVLKKLRNEIGLSGMTLQQLNNHLKALKVELYNARGDAAFTKKLRGEIRLTEMEIVKLKTGASKLAQQWEKVALTANKFGAMVGYVMMAVYLFTRAVGQVVCRMKDLEDRIGGVRKLAKLTRDEVWELKIAFDELGTRTKTDKLLDMSKIAGRLGVEGKDNILKFVQAADMISVALKESLGDDVEEIMRKMGKLVNVFRLTDEMTLDNAMLRIGSVLNELDKRSAASAESILEYTYRLSSYAEVVRLSAPDVMGLAAALDSLGVRAEMGSTQILKLMRGMGKKGNAEQFARIIGKTADEYERMLASDPNEVFLSLLEMFGSSAENMIQMEKLMEDYGVDGQRIVQVLGPLINNLDIVRKQQQIANEEFEKGTSVLMEFEIMNSTFGAEIDKLTKTLRGMADMLYKKLMVSVLSIYKKFIDFAIALKELKIWLVDHARLIKFLIGVYVAFRTPAIYRTILLMNEELWLRKVLIQEKLNLIWKKLSVLWTTRLTVAQARLVLNSKALSLAYLIIHGRFKKAILLFRTMTLTAAGTTAALIAITGTIAVLTGVFYLLRNKVANYTDAQKKMNEMSLEVSKNYGEERSKLDQLFNAYKNAEDKQKARIDLIKILNSEYSDYLGYTIDEKNNLYDVAKAYVDITTAMQNKIKLEGLQNTRNEMSGEKESLNEQIKMKEAELKRLEDNADSYLGGVDPDGTAAITFARKTNKLTSEIETLKASAKSYGEEIGKVDVEIAKLGPSLEELASKFQKVNLTDREYEDELAALKFQQTEREALFTERTLKEKKNEDWLNEQKLRSDITYYVAKKALDEKMGKEEDVLEGRIEIANAYIKLREDQSKADKKNGKASEDVLKEQIANTEELYGGLQAQERERYSNSEITKLQHDRNVLRLEIAKLEQLKAVNEEYGGDIADINKKLGEANEEYAGMQTDEEEKYEKIKKAREEALADELHQLTKRYIEEKEVRDNFNQLALDAELAMLDTLRQARIDLGLDTIEIDRVIAEKRKEGYDSQVKDAKDFSAELDAVLGKRERNYISKLIAYNQEIVRTEQNVTLAAEEKEAKLSLLKQRLADANEAEALSWAQSAQSAVDGAETMEEATAAVLNMVRQKISAYLAEAIAGAIAQEMATKGIFGVVTAGLAAAAVTVLFNTLIPKFGTDSKTGKVTATTLKPFAQTPQKAEGQYPVIGADDGLLYNAFYRGPVKSGIYSQPTLLDMAGGRTLVGETRLPELVIDGKTFQKMRMNSPQLVNDIYTVAGRVPQYAKGNYPQGFSNGTSGPGQEKVLAELVALGKRHEQTLAMLTQGFVRLESRKNYVVVEEINNKNNTMRKIEVESKMMGYGING